MALSVSQTGALGKLLKPGMRVASMGYPDLIAPINMIGEIMGDKFAQLAYRADSLSICARHGLKNRDIPDAESFFSLMGAKLDVFDIVKERGCEILCDLNLPLERFRPLSTKERAAVIGDPVSKEEMDTWLMCDRSNYDIVLDVGTIEHCFNIGTAMMNMAGLLNMGGIIIHENPFNCGNHGFYSLNPTWYADFYSANGFELMECRLATKDGRGAVVHHTKRFRFIAEECNVFAMARRVRVQPFVFPIQSKYATPAAGDRAKEKAA